MPLTGLASCVSPPGRRTGCSRAETVAADDDGAARQPRATGAVAERHRRFPRVVLPHVIDRAASIGTEEARHLAPLDAADPHRQRAAHTVLIGGGQRRDVRERFLLQRERLVGQRCVADTERLGGNRLTAAEVADVGIDVRRRVEFGRQAAALRGVQHAGPEVDAAGQLGGRRVGVGHQEPSRLGAVGRFLDRGQQRELRVGGDAAVDLGREHAGVLQVVLDGDCGRVRTERGRPRRRDGDGSDRCAYVRRHDPGRRRSGRRNVELRTGRDLAGALRDRSDLERAGGRRRAGDEPTAHLDVWHDTRQVQRRRTRSRRERVGRVRPQLGGGDRAQQARSGDGHRRRQLLVELDADVLGAVVAGDLDDVLGREHRAGRLAAADQQQMIAGAYLGRVRRDQQLAGAFANRGGAGRGEPPSIEQRMHACVGVDFEDLRRFAAERGRPHGKSGRQHDREPAAGLDREANPGRDRRTGPVAEQADEHADGRVAASSPQIAFVRDRLVVEREHVADVRPHLDEHDAEVLVAAGAPLRQRRLGRDGGQHRAAKLGEGRDLARDRGQAGIDRERLRMHEHVARTVRCLGGHAPPSGVSWIEPRSGCKGSFSTRTTSFWPGW